MTNKNKGWVKLWREQFQHWISERKPWCDGYAWSYLYAQANHKAGVVNFRNQYIPIERGQFITSKLKLQEIFGWSWRRTNSFLTALETQAMCAIRVSNRFIMITICNYEKYQSNEDENGRTDGIPDGRTGDEQAHTNKNDKNEKKTTLREPPDSRVREFLKYHGEMFKEKFEAIYKVDGGKEGAIIKRLLKTHSLEDLKKYDQVFFRMKDSFIEGSGYTLGALEYNIHKVVVESKKKESKW